VVLHARVARLAVDSFCTRDLVPVSSWHGWLPDKPSVKQIGSRATLTILQKLEAREKKRAQQKKERKFTDQEPPEIAQQTRTLTAAQAADAARDRSGRPSVCSSKLL
jgi:hypothetical protein